MGLAFAFIVLHLTESLTFSKRRSCQTVLLVRCLPLLNENYVLSIVLLQSCFAETMRASVFLVFAFLTLAFVGAYAVEKVSVYDNIDSYFTVYGGNIGGSRCLKLVVHKS